MLVNETVYTRLTPEKVHDIVQAYRNEQAGEATRGATERGS
jgi:hypothetical protein